MWKSTYLLHLTVNLTGQSDRQPPTPYTPLGHIWWPTFRNMVCTCLYFIANNHVWMPQPRFWNATENISTQQLFFSFFFFFFLFPFLLLLPLSFFFFIIPQINNNLLVSRQTGHFIHYIGIHLGLPFGMFTRFTSTYQVYSQFYSTKSN